MFVAEREIIDAINAVDPGITLATLDHLKAVNAGRMVATVKIIPYGVPEAAVARALDIASEGRAVGIDPYRPHAHRRGRDEAAFAETLCHGQDHPRARGAA